MIPRRTNGVSLLLYAAWMLYVTRLWVFEIYGMVLQFRAHIGKVAEAKLKLIIFPGLKSPDNYFVQAMRLWRYVERERF